MVEPGIPYEQQATLYEEVLQDEDEEFNKKKEEFEDEY